MAEPDRDREGVKGKDRERKVSAKVTYTSHVLHKFKKSPPQAEPTTVPPHLLPEVLRICLEVIKSSVLDSHSKLSDGLRKRYDEQYPLVHSLEDVFVSNVSLLTLLDQPLILSTHTGDRTCCRCPCSGKYILAVRSVHLGAGGAGRGRGWKSGDVVV